MRAIFNDDYALGPPNPDAAIDNETNPLPYWRLVAPGLVEQVVAVGRHHPLVDDRVTRYLGRDGQTPCEQGAAYYAVVRQPYP